MARKPGSSRLTRRKPAKPEETPKTVETTVTFLEMAAHPLHHVPPPINMKLVLVQAHEVPVHFYRYLYDTIGQDHNWIDRRLMSDDALAEAISRPEVDIFVAYVDGCPAGYYEIDASDADVAWIAYFGIVPDYHGRGLGKWLLSEAVASAWATKPRVVRVETCTLDDPRALPLYQKMGFVPYRRMDKTMPALA